MRPWAEVFVNGVGTGKQTPWVQTLTSGRHRVRLVGATKSEVLEITVDPVRGTSVTSDTGVVERFKPGRPIEIKRNWQ